MEWLLLMFIFINSLVVLNSPNLTIFFTVFYFVEFIVKLLSWDSSKKIFIDYFDMACVFFSVLMQVLEKQNIVIYLQLLRLL